MLEILFLKKQLQIIIYGVIQYDNICINLLIGHIKNVIAEEIHLNNLYLLILVTQISYALIKDLTEFCINHTDHHM